MKQLAFSRTPLHCNALLPLPQLETETSTSFLIGQYELNETNKELREGRIDLASLSVSSENGVEFNSSVTSLALPKCGVFDIVPIYRVFSGNNEASTPGGVAVSSTSVAVGSTDGSVKIISITTNKNENDNSAPLLLSVSQTYHMGEEMVTSCFVIQNEIEKTMTIASTHHKGTISYLVIGEGGVEKKKFSFEAHEYDAWSIAPISPLTPHIFFSGGDDAKLKKWDLSSKLFASTTKDEEQDEEEEEEIKCVSHCTGFDAGVVSIVPQNPKILLVGSYDEHVYVIDTDLMVLGSKTSNRVAGEKAIAAKQRIGGGGWRLREVTPNCVGAFYPVSNNALEGNDTIDKSGTKKKIFAVAAMQAGSEVIFFDEASSKLESVGWPSVSAEKMMSIHHTAFKNDQQEAEEPLVYDVCQIGGGGKFPKVAFATVSFYTNEVRCWGL